MRRLPPVIFLFARTLLAAGLLANGACRAQEPALRVFAAASTARVLPRLGELYAAGSRQPAPRFSFAASSTLARQIQQGAPADLFLSAAPEWMDELEKRSRLQADSRRDLLGNRLVLIATTRRPLPDRPGEFDPAALHGRFAIGDPAHVPAGKYAESALRSLGWWPALRSRLVPAGDVRAALRFVARGECEYGLVYASDAQEAGVRQVMLLPAATHPPIRYPIALIERDDDSSRAAARAFYDFLFSPRAAAVFEEYGFTALYADAR